MFFQVQELKKKLKRPKEEERPSLWRDKEGKQCELITTLNKDGGRRQNYVTSMEGVQDGQGDGCRQRIFHLAGGA